MLYRRLNLEYPRVQGSLELQELNGTSVFCSVLTMLAYWQKTYTKTLLNASKEVGELKEN
jgi:hypothetical protein